MPCSDGGVPYSPSKEELAERAFIKRAHGMLCSACRALESFGYDFDLNPELSDWWAKHKAEDEERQRKEQAKRLELERVNEVIKKPFKDLTADEKNLLKKHGYM
jgi:hypothetical protein